MSDVFCGNYSRKMYSPQTVKYCGLFREGGTVQCTNKWRVKLLRNIKLQECRVLYKREGMGKYFVDSKGRFKRI